MKTALSILKEIISAFTVPLMSSAMVGVWWAMWFASGRSIPTVNEIRISDTEWWGLPFSVSRWWDTLAVFVFTSFIVGAIQSVKKENWRFFGGAFKLIWCFWLLSAWFSFLTLTIMDRAEELSLAHEVFSAIVAGYGMAGAALTILYFVRQGASFNGFHSFLLSNFLFSLSWGALAFPLLGGVVGLFVTSVVFVMTSAGGISTWFMILLIMGGREGR